MYGIGNLFLQQPFHKMDGLGINVPNTLCRARFTKCRPIHLYAHGVSGCATVATCVKEVILGWLMIFQDVFMMMSMFAG